MMSQIGQFTLWLFAVPKNIANFGLIGKSVFGLTKSQLHLGIPKMIHNDN